MFLDMADHIKKLLGTAYGKGGITTFPERSSVSSMILVRLYIGSGLFVVSVSIGGFHHHIICL